MSFSSRAKAYKGIATNAASAVTDLSELVRQAQANEVPLCDISAHHQFTVLTLPKKNEVLSQLVKATSVGAFVLHQLNLDDSSAELLADLIRANKGLGLLSVERNNLREAGLLAIAKAAKGHANLRELRLGEQREPISTNATIALIEVMEGTPSLLKLGLGSIRDDLLNKRLQAATMHNKDLVRQARVKDKAVETEPAWVAAWEARSNTGKAALAASGGASSAARQKNKGSPISEGLAGKAAAIDANVGRALGNMRAVDWMEEARRIRSNEPPQYGQGASGDSGKVAELTNSPSLGSEGSVSYSLTGNGSWLRAKDDERYDVIAAFGTNTSIDTVIFASANVDETLGVLWGQVLERNRTITSLNLESNTLQTESITAIANALKGTPALKELRLANQHKKFAQAVEASLAEAMEANHRIIKLAVDLKSTQAKDRIARVLDRNQQEAREAKKNGGEVPFGPPTSTDAIPTKGGGGGGAAAGPDLDHGAVLAKARGPVKKRARKKRPSLTATEAEGEGVAAASLPQVSLYADAKGDAPSAAPKAAAAPASAPKKSMAAAPAAAKAKEAAPAVSAAKAKVAALEARVVKEEVKVAKEEKKAGAPSAEPEEGVVARRRRLFGR